MPCRSCRFTQVFWTECGSPSPPWELPSWPHCSRQKKRRGSCQWRFLDLNKIQDFAGGQLSEGWHLVPDLLLGDPKSYGSGTRNWRAVHVFPKVPLKD